MKYSYKINLEENFNEKLAGLSKQNQEIELYSIRLELLYSKSNYMDIPIDRIRKTEEGNVFCEAILGGANYATVCLGSKGEEPLYFYRIRLITLDQTLAGISAKGEIEIDLTRQKDPITIISAHFKTAYPDAIKNQLPETPANEHYYLIHDKNEEKELDRPKSNEVIFYTGKKFSGNSYTYKLGDKVENLVTSNLNDMLNSVKVGSLCKLTLFRDVYYKGPSKKIYFDTENIDIGGLSSFIVDKQ